MASVVWLEDAFKPRIDQTTRRVWWWTRTIRVEHPDRFMPGDLVRLVPQREAIWVKEVTVDGRLRVLRSIGRVRRVFAGAGTELLIIGGNFPDHGARAQQRNWRGKKTGPFS